MSSRSKNEQLMLTALFKKKEERRREEEERRRQEEERQRQEEERLEQDRREAERLEMERREESLREMQGQNARQALIDSAFDDLEDACESDNDVLDGPLPQGKPGKAKGRSAADWASRALMAMDGDSDEDDSDEGDGEDSMEADMQLVKLTGAIAKKIDRIHNR